MTELTKTTETTPENGVEDSNVEFEVKPADTVQMGAIVAIEYTDFPGDPPVIFKIIDTSKGMRPKSSFEDDLYELDSTDGLSQAVLGNPVGAEVPYTGREDDSFVVRIVDFKNPSRP